MMNRRDVLKAGLAAGMLPITRFAQAREDRHVYELRIYELRSDIEPARIQTFLREHLLPVYQRLRLGPVGVFTPESGLPRESLVVLTSYPSLAAIRDVRERLRADAEFAVALRAFETNPELPYVRYEARLMEAFAGFPQIDLPPTAAGRSPRLFEMRTYESKSAATLERKIDQFHQGEVALFRKSGMTPVLFGENLFAPRLPSLSYMVGFDDMAARTRAWATFRADPEWIRMNADPRWAVEGAVSVSHIVLLNALPFSDIR